MALSDSKLTIKICHKNPIELIDFTDCLQSFGQQYKRYVAKRPEETEAEGIKLYVEKIESGSIVAQLAPYAPYALPFINDVNSIIGFSNYLNTFFSFLLGKVDTPPENIEKIDYEQGSKILNPIANDNGAQINVSNVFNGDVNLFLDLDSNDANAAQNRAKKEIERLKEPVDQFYEKVVIYWYQARNDSTTNAGNFGIAESISKKPVKIIFADDNIKIAMLTADDKNPFKKAYIVDIVVETVMGNPVLYKVIGYHEKFDIAPIDNENLVPKLF